MKTFKDAESLIQGDGTARELLLDDGSTFTFTFTNQEEGWWCRINLPDEVVPFQPIYSETIRGGLGRALECIEDREERRREIADRLKGVAHALRSVIHTG